MLSDARVGDTTATPVRTGTTPKILYVASTGGHLTELARLSSDWSDDDSSVWLTFDSAQSRSLLAGRRMRFVPYVRPRDILGVVRTFIYSVKLLRSERFDLVVSTGAAVAIGVLPAARLLRVPSHYIESVARVSGPSVTGRIVSALRTSELYTQHPGWAGGRWGHHDSILTQFHSVEKPATPGVDADAPALFVTVGTISPYRFDALVDAVLASGLADERTVWQLGSTTRTDLPGRVVEFLTPEEFEKASVAADVVVAHAGVGTILGLLDLGIHPVIVPRRRSRDEHVDDHQREIADHLRSLRVGEVAEVGELTRAILESASMLSVVPGRRA